MEGLHGFVGAGGRLADNDRAVAKQKPGADNSARPGCEYPWVRLDPAVGGGADAERITPPLWSMQQVH